MVHSFRSPNESGITQKASNAARLDGYECRWAFLQAPAGKSSEGVQSYSMHPRMGLVGSLFGGCELSE
jgi:hypothetical protein